MSRRKPHVLIDTPKVRCPSCLGGLKMLCRVEVDRPAFYICWHCQTVAEIGVGFVRPIDKDLTEA